MRGRILPADAAFAATILAMAVYYLQGLGRYLINDDEGSYLYAAWRISLGEVPYRDFLTPQLPAFLLGGGALIRAVGAEVVPARAAAVLAAIGAVVVLWWVVRRLLGAGPAFVAGAVLGLSPDVFLELRTFRPDPFMILAAGLGFAAFARAVIPRPGAIEAPSRRWLALSGVLFGVGALIKLFSPFILAGCLLWLLDDARRRGRPWARVVVDGAVVGGVAAAVTAAGLGAFALAGAPVFASVLGHHLAQGAGLPWIAVIGKGLAFQVTFLRHHALEMFLAISAAAVAWRDNRREAALFAWQLPTALLFLALSRELFPRHLIYLLPAVAALVGWAVCELWRAGARFARPAAVAVVLALVFPWVLLDRDFAWRHEDGTRRVADVAALLTPADQMLLSDYSELNFFARRATTYSAASLSAGAGGSGQITWAGMRRELEDAGEAPGLVLVDRTSIEGTSYGHFRFLHDVDAFEAWLAQGYVPLGTVWRRLRLPDRQEHEVYWPRTQPVPLIADMGEVRLLAAGWPRHDGVLDAGEVLPVASVWSAEKRPTEDVAVTVRLVDGLGRQWAQSDSGLLAAEERPTSKWDAGEMTATTVELRLPEGVPPGEYDVVLGAYRRSDGALLEAKSGANPSAVGRVRVVPWLPGRVGLSGLPRFGGQRPLIPPPAGAPRVQGLELLGHGPLPGTPITAGDSFEVDTWWRVVQPTSGASLRFTLGDRLTGTVAADVVAALGTDAAGTSGWPIGTVVSQSTIVSVLASTGAGAFSLAVAPATAADAAAGAPIEIGTVTVVPRDTSDMITEAPAVDVVSGAIVGGFAELVGWGTAAPTRRSAGTAASAENTAAPMGRSASTAAPLENPAAMSTSSATAAARIDGAPGDEIEIDLVWRALAAAPGRYKVTVQAVDDDGNPVLQHDGEPADWSRPTTGWIPGEVIVDSHVIVLPETLTPGPYRLFVAMYDTVTGRRLPVTAGAAAGDKVELGVLQVAR